MSPRARNLKTRSDVLGIAENKGARNLKTGPGALDTSKMSLRVRNLKTGPCALSTAENEVGNVKLEN
jgi:hypothetical protein